MAKKITKNERPDDTSRATLQLREAVLEKLLQLHIDFGVLGCLEQAGPQLYQLMEIAYYVQPPGDGIGSKHGKGRLRRADLKATFN